MHTIDLLEEALKLATQEGITVRRQWLGETTGGACRIGNQRVLFVNLSLSAEEQLQQAIDGLRGAPLKTQPTDLSAPLRRLLL